ncbi:hypothetical protein IC582_026166 [Cucumis melo]
MITEPGIDTRTMKRMITICKRIIEVSSPWAWICSEGLLGFSSN